MIEDAVYVVREIVDFLKNRNKVSDDALSALMRALHETEGYLYDRSRTGEVRAREISLSGLWTECAVLFRNENPDLANRLSHKARSWAVPDEYERSDLETLRIDISEIRKEAISCLNRSAVAGDL